MQVIGVRRALRFSPNNEEKDLAILRSVVAPWDGEIILEEDPSLPELLTTATVVFSMARTSWALSCLDEAERRGVCVLNPPEGVRRCARSVLQRLAEASSVPVPPREGTAGWWLKRGDAAAQSRADVVFCPDRPALDRALADFRSRGIDDYLIQAHLPGDLVKFYGVLSTSFFRFFYPGDDGQSKFGDESHNGRPHHYAFSQYDLHAAASRLATAARCPIYGGDAIISPDGSFVLIDFNDWPSYSRCRSEAAEAIRQLVTKEEEITHGG